MSERMAALDLVAGGQELEKDFNIVVRLGLE